MSFMKEKKFLWSKLGVMSGIFFFGAFLMVNAQGDGDSVTNFTPDQFDQLIAEFTSMDNFYSKDEATRDLFL